MGLRPRRSIGFPQEHEIELGRPWKMTLDQQAEEGCQNTTELSKVRMPHGPNHQEWVHLLWGDLDESERIK